MKQCSTCKLSFPYSEFHKNKAMYDGYCHYCKKCRSIKEKEYYHKDVDKTRSKKNIYNSLNVDNKKLAFKRYYNKNKEKVLKKNRKYNKLYSKNRKLRDISFKIRVNLSVRIAGAVKSKGTRKHKKTLELLGCTILEFRKHLESKFLPTMTWENYGSYWHIDHIIPCVKFDLTKEEEQKRCFHYSNLQPLFAVTQVIDGVEYIGNINKGDKVEIMIKNISAEKFTQLLQKGYSCDFIYILLCIKKGIPGESLKSNSKMELLVSTVIRKGLLTEDFKITLDGEKLLEFAESEDPNSRIQKIPLKSDDFELFWKTFPASDTFEYKGRKFAGSRALRINKEECKNKLKSILNTGEYTITDIVEAIKIDVAQKKEASMKTGTNKLSYIQNSLTYLRQLSFDPFVELYKAGHKEESKDVYTGGVEI